LLEGGANVNARNSGGQTALMILASRAYNPETVALLLGRGGDINARDSENGWTALMWAAAFSGNPEIITLLLENGADAVMRDYYGRLAIDLVESNLSIDRSEAFERFNSF